MSEPLNECRRCRAVTLTPFEEDPAPECPECSDAEILSIPYLRPNGFTVDAALPDGGREKYRSGGREPAGYTPSAQLLVGTNAVSGGQNNPSFAPNLYSYVRVGDLFVRNMGPPDRGGLGFLLCPACGRLLDDDTPEAHTYPADVPPHRGYRVGPRAGQPCPNEADFNNRIALGHRFRSEVILLALDMPDFLDAPLLEAPGRAVWYSFGTLMSEAAARVLQISPDEIQVGVRPMRDSFGRIQGEVFIYDDVPGGAGYARAIQDNLEEVAQLALDMGRNCPNADCGGACYHCLLGYRNQRIHNLLDRNLGVSVLEYLLNGQRPHLLKRHGASMAEGLNEYVGSRWKLVDPGQSPGQFDTVFDTGQGHRVGIRPVHPLAARPTTAVLTQILRDTGILPRIYTSFDLLRRPFWVANNLFEFLRR